MEGGPTSPDVVGDNDGAAARSKTESREGWEVCLAGGGEEDAELVSELNLWKNEFSLLALSRHSTI